MANKNTIGELIEKEVRKQQISITAFAELIYCKRNNVYDIFKRSKMDIVQLKRISEVLNRNFFKELAEDVELIRETEDSEESLLRGKAVGQFFNVVPDVLKKMGKPVHIVFCELDDAGYEGCRTPDFGLSSHFITFTIGETLRERIGNNPLLPIVLARKDGFEVEICTNVIHKSVCVNMNLEYRTADEWYKLLSFAFEVYERYGRL